MNIAAVVSPAIVASCVNTVDSTNIDTPIIGLVIEDAWNWTTAYANWHGGSWSRPKSAVRERIGSDRQWFLVFQDGRELRRRPHWTRA